MLLHRAKPSTLNFLEKAILASQSKTEHLFRGDTLALIGVAYTNDMTTTELLAKTELSNVIIQNKDMTATITLKAEPSQLDELKTIEETFNLVGGGAFLDSFKVEKPTLSSSFLIDLIGHNTPLSNIQDYHVELHLENADVQLSEAKLMKETLYQFTITEKREHTLGTFTQGLILLFRKRTFDDENLFSTLCTTTTKGMPEPRLNKRDTMTLMDIIMTPNLTGCHIGSVLFTPKNNSITAVVYPMTGSIVIGVSPNKYHWVADTGMIDIDHETIRYATIKKVSNGHYIFSIYTPDGAVRISLG